MEGSITTTDSAALTPMYVQPKTAHINVVDNGFTVSLQGGEQKSFGPTKLYVAKTLDEAIELVSDHLKA
jgi:hypothetical protein